MRSKPNPVFYDPNGKRSKIFNALGFLTVVGAILGLAAVAFGIFYAPRLPSLLGEGTEPIKFAKTGKRPALRSDQPGYSLLEKRRLPDSTRAITRFAYFSSNDPNSIQSLRRNAADLDALIPTWLQVEKLNGEIGQGYLATELKIGNFLKKSAPHVQIYPKLESELDAADTASVLANPASRQTLIEGLSRYLRQRNYAGITIDATDLPQSSGGHLVQFLYELRSALQPENRKIIVEARLDEPLERQKEMSAIADYLLVNIHDERADESAAHPIAGQQWFEANIIKELTQLDPAKLIIGIGSYGYDWAAADAAKQIPVQAAWDLLKETNAGLRTDARTLNPGFSYLDRKGGKHDVWYLDGTTFYNHLLRALSVQPAGIALWRLGLEDPSLWACFGRGRLPDRDALSALANPSAGDGYTFEDLKKPVFTSIPSRPGSREITYDVDLGLIVGQSMVRGPVRAKLKGWEPTDKKAIALTFDDGPDDKFTPKILDVLAEKSVRASFFVIGVKSLQSPDALERIYKEGHDLGNHSFSHSNLFRATTNQIELELNATQRVFESQLGIRSALFRAPYTSTALWTELGADRMVETAARLGYVYANLSVDSNDWSNLSADQIVERVTGPILNGVGQIVLLHDSGGNRDETVKALPRIIDTLRAEGYRFVPLHELLGKTRQEIMPTINEIPITARMGVNIRSIVVGPLIWFSRNLPTIAIAVTILGGTRLLLIMIAAWIQARRERRRRSLQWWPRRVTVIVPAYNEEKVICKTVQSLLLAWTELDIIVVDDGSSDNTARIASQTFAGNSRVRVYRKENGGKASALNFGLHHTDAEVVVAIDADTVLSHDAIQCLVRHFYDPDVGAVAGTAVVGNCINLITRFQALEYVTSQNLDRRAFELLNCIGVVPGAIGAWRRTALLQAGGYSHDTLAEDADLTIAIERLGWKVLYEPRSCARTEAPETVNSFLKQRFRWMFGTLQVAWKHRGAIWSTKSPAVAWVAIPNIFLFQFAFTLLAPVMDAILLWLIMSTIFSVVSGGGGVALAGLWIVALYWMAFQVFDIVSAGFAIALAGDWKSLRLLPLLILQRFSYRQLLYFIAIRSLFAAIKGRFVGWGKLLRTGTVTLRAGTAN